MGHLSATKKSLESGTLNGQKPECNVHWKKGGRGGGVKETSCKTNGALRKRRQKKKHRGRIVSRAKHQPVQKKKLWIRKSKREKGNGWRDQYESSSKGPVREGAGSGCQRGKR